MAINGSRTDAVEPGTEQPDALTGEGSRTRDWGGVLIAALFIVVGGYFLLRNTFGLTLPDIEWDRLWPVLVIVMGLAVLVRGWTGHSHRQRRRSRRD